MSAQKQHPNGPITKAETWYWLENNERTVLEDLNPEARPIINQEFDFMTILESQTAVIGTSSKPWLPEKHIIEHERVRRMVQVHHPLSPDYTKMDWRECVQFKARSKYGLGDKWVEMARLCMHPDILKRLAWSIYAPSTGPGGHDFYLSCDLPGPANAHRVQLYVPTSYFRLKDWSIVEKRHTEGAVNYYKGGGFNVPERILKNWQELEAAALTCLEARVLRAIVES